MSAPTRAELRAAEGKTVADVSAARLGRQSESLGGTALWVLPNPSGLNANYQLAQLVRLFRALRKAATH
jgi:G:T/U-mismatch repair DNA glycosylase